ncbi:unnamed protein product, partial [Staurois parvus]
YIIIIIVIKKKKKIYIYTVFFTPQDAHDHKTRLVFRGGKQEKKYSEPMDCRHSTGDDKRLRT